ncbi:hypothetical protein EON65_30570 [archaeon]|nr:MAG: hypothetical protein EON65_30570 [archaeon]
MRWVGKRLPTGHFCGSSLSVITEALSRVTMLSTASGCLQMAARRAGTFYTGKIAANSARTQVRTMFLIGSEKDSEKFFMSQMNDYAGDIERMGCNDHPGFKRVSCHETFYC